MRLKDVGYKSPHTDADCLFFFPLSLSSQARCVIIHSEICPWTDSPFLPKLRIVLIICSGKIKETLALIRFLALLSDVSRILLGSFK